MALISLIISCLFCSKMRLLPMYFPIRKSALVAFKKQTWAGSLDGEKRTLEKSCYSKSCPVLSCPNAWVSFFHHCPCPPTYNLGSHVCILVFHAKCDSILCFTMFIGHKIQKLTYCNFFWKILLCANCLTQANRTSDNEKCFFFD